MRIVIAGGTGFLGQHLVRQLRAEDHELSLLVRGTPAGPGQVRWRPDEGVLAPELLAGADMVINLAGASVGTRRWTEGYKRVIRASRVDTTGTLARVAAALPPARRPKLFLAQSAVGWYGDTGDTPVDENAPRGEGYLADVARDWEDAAIPAADAGVRVVWMRTGIPLAGDGGMLKPLLWQFRLFAGGRMGNGRQYIPWISMDDWLGAVRFLIDRADLAGPVNVTGPAPVTNAEFAAALGRVLRRPSFWAVPTVALRIVLGEFGGESVASQRVLPGVLLNAGYEFRHQDVESALLDAVG